MSNNGTIRCYTCKHRCSVCGEYNPYCEENCGDAWQGYEPEEDDDDPYEALVQNGLKMWIDACDKLLKRGGSDA